jgi:threonine dehydrogenase-like Zn-dependent dehydrogenase
MNTMSAAIFEGDGRVGVRRMPRPQMGPDQVLIRTHGSGVCASNLPVWSGRPWFSYPLAPGAPGHEGWGEIDAVGDAVENFSVGDRVAFLSSNAYAEFDVAPASALARIPSTLDGLPFPGEPLACAMNILRRSEIRAGQRVAVVGVGFIGALLIQLAKKAGAQVIALSRRPFALEIAKQCGAAECISTSDSSSAIVMAMELTDQLGCDRVVEAAGEQTTLDIASAIVSEGGRLIIAGYHQDGLRTVNLQHWNWRGIDVINAHERDPAVAARGLREAVAAVAANELDPFPLITHHVALDRLEHAFALMQERPDGFLKATVNL